MIDVVVGSQHLLYIVDNGLHFRQIAVAKTKGLVDPAIVHAGGIFYGYLSKYRIRHVEGPLIKGANHGHSPANGFNGALNVLIRRPHPVADRKRPVQEDHQGTKKVGQQTASGETHSDTAHPAEG